MKKTKLLFYLITLTTILGFSKPYSSLNNLAFAIYPNEILSDDISETSVNLTALLSSDGADAGTVYIWYGEGETLSTFHNTSITVYGNVTMNNVTISTTLQGLKANQSYAFKWIVANSNNTITYTSEISYFTTMPWPEGIVWKSDFENYQQYELVDSDGDSNNWSFYGGGGESWGFNSGVIAYSASYDNNLGPLTPDNKLLTPELEMPSDASSLSFKMRVAAFSANNFAEKFGIYIYDVADTDSDDTLIYEETLTEGGAGTAKNITAVIPVFFAGKNIKIYVRHFDCTNQYQLLVDDFEVSYETTLTASIDDLENNSFSIYPNPTNNTLFISGNESPIAVSIYNMLGKEVLSVKNTNNINVQALPSGVYMIRISDGVRQTNRKFIKN